MSVTFEAVSSVEVLFYDISLILGGYFDFNLVDDKKMFMGPIASFLI